MVRTIEAAMTSGFSGGQGLVVAKVAKQIPKNTEHRKLMYPKEASQKQNSYI